MVRGLLIDNYQTSILKVPGLLNCLKQGGLLLETVLDKGYGLPLPSCSALFALHSALSFGNRITLGWISPTCSSSFPDILYVDFLLFDSINAIIKREHCKEYIMYKIEFYENQHGESDVWISWKRYVKRVQPAKMLVFNTTRLFSTLTCLLKTGQISRPISPSI